MSIAMIILPRAQAVSRNRAALFYPTLENRARNADVQITLIYDGEITFLKIRHHKIPSTKREQG